MRILLVAVVCGASVGLSALVFWGIYHELRERYERERRERLYFVDKGER